MGNKVKMKCLKLIIINDLCEIVVYFLLKIDNNKFLLGFLLSFVNNLR